jgi:hypothetical protein
MGSLVHHEVPTYVRSRWIMAVHTVCAGLAILRGVLQFSKRVRRNWPVLHRLVGRLTLIVVAASMAMALAFYSGPVRRRQPAGRRSTTSSCSLRTLFSRVIDCHPRGAAGLYSGNTWPSLAMVVVPEKFFLISPSHSESGRSGGA